MYHTILFWHLYSVFSKKINTKFQDTYFYKHYCLIIVCKYSSQYVICVALRSETVTYRGGSATKIIQCSP